MHQSAAVVWPFSALFSRYTYTMVATFDRELTQIHTMHIIALLLLSMGIICVCVCTFTVHHQ